MIDNSLAKEVAQALSWTDEEQVKAIARAISIEARAIASEVAAELEAKDETVDSLDPSRLGLQAIEAIAEKFRVKPTDVIVILQAFPFPTIQEDAERWEHTMDTIGEMVIGCLNPTIGGGPFEWRTYYDSSVNGTEVLEVRPALVDHSGGSGDLERISCSPVKLFDLASLVNGLGEIVEEIETYGYAVDDDDGPHIYIEAMVDGSPITIYVYLEDPFEDAEPVELEEVLGSDQDVEPAH